MAARRGPPLPWLKPAVITGALVPLAAMPIRAAAGMLGANPISEALNELGLLALVFLIASLACSPAKALFGWTWPIRIRRNLGVLAFTYAALHFGTYAVLDQGLDLATIVGDITQRKFIFVGFASLALMAPLAITSTDRMVRRLGFERWKLLHRLAYVAAGLGVVHFIWRVKSDLTEPMVYAAILAVLLGARVLTAVRARKPKARAAT
jgi:methionine sulfoxide reductase heme-binding subunit